jgi:hypothetical protein
LAPISPGARFLPSGEISCDGAGEAGRMGDFRGDFLPVLRSFFILFFPNTICKNKKKKKKNAGGARGRPLLQAGGVLKKV